MIDHWGSYYQCQPCKEKSLEFSWDCTHKDIKKLLKSAWIFEYALHDAVTYRKLLGNTHKISPTARLIEWKDSTRAQIYDMFEYALGTFNSPGKVSIH